MKNLEFLSLKLSLSVSLIKIINFYIKINTLNDLTHLFIQNTFREIVFLFPFLKF